MLFTEDTGVTSFLRIIFFGSVFKALKSDSE